MDPRFTKRLSISTKRNCGSNNKIRELSMLLFVGKCIKKGLWILCLYQQERDKHLTLKLVKLRKAKPF